MARRDVDRRSVKMTMTVMAPSEPALKMCVKQTAAGQQCYCKKRNNPPHPFDPWFRHEKESLRFLSGQLPGLSHGHRLCRGCRGRQPALHLFRHRFLSL
jgi:hypothetical protein